MKHCSEQCAALPVAVACRSADFEIGFDCSVVAAPMMVAETHNYLKVAGAASPADFMFVIVKMSARGVVVVPMLLSRVPVSERTHVSCFWSLHASACSR